METFGDYPGDLAWALQENNAGESADSDLPAKITVPKSECCQAAILQLDTTFGSDQCASCKKKIAYALMTPSWAKIEPCGVFEGFNGLLYFFWQQVGKWSFVEERIATSKHIYLGQIKRVVTTPAITFNCDGDRLTPSQERQFLREWMKKVANPEVSAELAQKLGL